ncbi:MAG: DEAD/DEAH box helicase [Deltaproteobacteria bacterium]|nr:DEAD/DEAH box helicase [Deltaproteobacteria bacterium]
MKFSEFNLDQDIIRGISEAGFKECLPVQEETFCHALKGEDVCVQSQTGTGKTAAFLVSIFQALTGGKRNGKCLIIAPTRELAVQIETEAKLLGRFLKLKTGCFYGGVGYRKQEELLEKGDIDILIGTPGRLIDFGRQGKIRFSEIGILVIDEADRLFDMGFLPDIRWMLKRMPGYSERQTMLFSATLGSRTRQIAWEHMNDPVEIILNPDRVTVDAISQAIYHVESREKMSLLLGILKKSEKGNALIFTNTKKAAFMVAKRLEHNGYSSEYLIGDLPQNKRQENIEDFKSGRLQYLVATDVAARGIHIDNLDLVVNFDLPENPEDYVHRIGRTGRTGKSGRAVTLACEEFVLGLEALEAFIDMKIPVISAYEASLEHDESSGMQFSLQRKVNDRHPVRPRQKAVHRDRVLTASRSPRKNAPVNTEKKRKTARKKDVIRRISPDVSDEDRLAFYSRKYGENFNVVSHQTGRDF